MRALWVHPCDSPLLALWIMACWMELSRYALEVLLRLRPGYGKGNLGVAVVALHKRQVCIGAMKEGEAAAD